MKKLTIDELESLENKILELFHTTDLSAETLADCMGKIDTERFKIEQANEAEKPTDSCNIGSVRDWFFCSFHGSCIYKGVGRICSNKQYCQSKRAK